MAAQSPAKLNPRDFFDRWEDKNKNKSSLKGLSKCLRALSEYDADELKKLLRDDRDAFLKTWGIKPGPTAGLATLLYIDLCAWLGVGNAGPASDSETDLVAPLSNVCIGQGNATTKAASGMALHNNTEGLDCSLGWLGLSLSFVPLGKARTALFDPLATLSAADEEVQKVAHALAMTVPHERALKKTLEASGVDRLQQTLFHMYWPDTVVSLMQEKQSVAGYQLCTDNKIDFSRVCRIATWPTASGDQVTTAERHFVTFVEEVKETSLPACDGLPQAFLAGCAAALSLREAGVPIADCVVPVVVNSGVSELHGAVYLLDPAMPCFVATSPTLDLLNPEQRVLAAKHRVLEKRYSAALDQLLLELSDFERRNPAPMQSIASVALNLTGLFIKHNEAPFFGCHDFKSAATSAHELSVFQRLSVHKVNSVVYPLARLMQQPQQSGRAQRSPVWTWSNNLCTVYPDMTLEGYKAGFHADRSWLDQVKSAVRQLHAAGVVHGDLFPCNILSKWSLDDGNGRRRCEDVKLVDLDASLLLGEFFPEACEQVIAYNGYQPMYHPKLKGGAIASLEFDKWFLAAFELQMGREVAGFDPEWWVSRPNPEVDVNTASHEVKLKEWFASNRDRILEGIAVVDGEPQQAAI